MGMGGYNPNSGLKNVAGANSMSNTLGYGSDSESRISLTRSGINTTNIQITDEANQIQLTGKKAEEAKAQVHTDTTTDNAQQLSGSLNNRFDKDRVQSELDLQREVSQDFSKNVQAANTEINWHLDKLKADKEAGKISEEEYNNQVENWQRGQVLLNAIASGLSAPTQSGVGIAAATASPALSYAIGQHFKDLAGQNANGELTTGQEAAHILAHAVLGAAVSAAGNNSALAGAINAGGAEAAAPVISQWLYGEGDGSKLTAEQKETVTAIANLLGAATGAAIGDTTANAVQGSLNAQGAVENNHLGSGFSIFGKEISPRQIKQFDEELKRNCNATGNAQKCLATYNKWRDLSYRQGGLDINDTSFENFAALMYQQEVLPLCKGNQQCETIVAYSMMRNIVISAGDTAGLRDLIEIDRRAVNISNGNWIRVGLDTLGDLTTLTGMRAMVNPNSAYARFMNSVFVKPSNAGITLPRTQLGSVGNITPQTINQIQQQTGIKLVFDRTTQIWTTPAGLDYGLGSIHGNHIKHVLDHTVPNPQKPRHSVFNVSRSQVLPLIDEAWRMKGQPITSIPNGRTVYEINMGKFVGTNGETHIRIVVETGTNKVITAFPFK